MASRSPVSRKRSIGLSPRSRTRSKLASALPRLAAVTPSSNAAANRSLYPASAFNRLTASATLDAISSGLAIGSRACSSSDAARPSQKNDGARRPG